MNYKIGEIVKKLNVKKETIRYYEKFGLLPEPKRDNNGYRLYEEEIIEILEFIRMAKKMGFKLKEIKYFLEEDILPRDINDVKSTIDKKIKEINIEIEKLEGKKKILTNANLMIEAGQCINCKEVKNNLENNID